MRSIKITLAAMDQPLSVTLSLEMVIQRKGDVGGFYVL